MATLDDRLLGEKLHYYCSSSEDDEEEEEDEEEDEEEGRKGAARGGVGGEVMPPLPLDQGWEGSSTNTGPKGVLKDWQRYKQLEAERRVEQERERIVLAKKLAMTCRSHLDDEKEKEAQKKEDEQDVDALLDEAFLRQYISRRMEEMVARTTKRVTFGRLVNLESREAFLDAVDKEEEEVTVIIHIFEKGVPGCSAMSGCLGCLAQDYPSVKFCTLPASVAGVSANFKAEGCPALLVYKGGQLVGNFVRLIDEFSDDFYATDVESFLVEHGILADRSLVPPGIRGPADDDSDDEDGGSDFSLDD